MLNKLNLNNEKVKDQNLNRNKEEIVTPKRVYICAYCGNKKNPNDKKCTCCGSAKFIIK